MLMCSQLEPNKQLMSIGFAVTACFCPTQTRGMTRQGVILLRDVCDVCVKLRASPRQPANDASIPLLRLRTTVCLSVSQWMSRASCEVDSRCLWLVCASGRSFGPLQSMLTNCDCGHLLFIISNMSKVQLDVQLFMCLSCYSEASTGATHMIISPVN